MTLGRTILISFALTACLVVFLLFRAASDPSDTEAEETIETPSSLKRYDSQPQPVELLPSSGETEDQDSESQQLKLAKQLLESKKPSDRIEAAERLSAYPSFEMEATLLKVLTEDANGDVRNAAAVGLGGLENPSEAAIAGLLRAMDDTQESVRFSALSTLEDYLLGLDPQSVGSLAISNGLRSKLENRKLPANLRASIREALKTQPSK